MTAVIQTKVTPFEQYADDKMRLRYAHVVEGRYEAWEDICHRVVYTVMQSDGLHVPKYIIDAVYEMTVQRKFIPGGRILSQAGREYHQTDNCFCLRAGDTREDWADLASKCTRMFMSGGGVGIDYSAIRPYGSPLSRSGGMASGPLPLIEMVNSIAAAARAGGERRGACYASLPWFHQDIDGFIKMKEVSSNLQHTNISVRFDNDFMNAYDDLTFTKDIFERTLKHACKYGDPGFQFDNDDQTLRNACGEIISADDSDSCCIGSVNLSAIADIDELHDVTNLAVLFLLCNTIYTDVPTLNVRITKNKNRRLGLGLMGVAEWFMQRGQPYGYTDLPANGHWQFSNSEYFIVWLNTWKFVSECAALRWSDMLSISKPVAVRAIAPTGTISIMGHTTSGIEPVFHTVYMRTSNTLKTREYADGFKQEVVIEPIVQKWIEQGYDVRDIDTAYTLSQSLEGIERRLAFQAYMQQFVDNAIASTVNLAEYTEGVEEKIAPVLLKYLPQLRGVTFYPNGRHANQPVTPVDVKDIHRFSDAVIESNDSCKSGECGL